MKFTYTGSPLFTLLVLLTVASMILAACNAPVAAPAATAAPVTELVASAATTAPATEPPQPELGGILFSDSFKNNDNNWSLSGDDNGDVQILDEQLVINIKGQEAWYWSFPQFTASDVDLSFDVIVKEGTPSNAIFGSVCGYVDDNNYYDFKMNTDGYYRLDKVLNGTEETLIGWSTSTAIKTGAGETNRIRVVCSGSILEFYANDQLMGKTRDKSLTAGSFALEAGSSDVDNAPVSVVFDNVEVKVPVVSEPPTGILLSDSFDNNNNQWQLYQEAGGSVQIQDGQLVVKVNEAAWYWAFQPVAAADVDLSFDVTLQKSAPNAMFGVTCRQDQDDYYNFLINESGLGIMGITVDGGWDSLVDKPAEPTPIKLGAGQTNRIRVVCLGDSLEFYANGKLLYKTKDASLTGRGFALQVLDPDGNASVAFDNLEAKEPSASAESPAGILFSDSFDNNDNQWQLYEQPGVSSAQIQNGEMVMRLETAKAVSWSGPQGALLSDVDISFDATLKEGTPSNAAFGAVCRVKDENNYYGFNIKDGSYILLKNVNGTFENLTDWTASTAIKTGPGQTNRLRVVCSGSNLEFYVNNQLVIQKQDTSHTSGEAALYAERWEVDNALVSVAFDNVEVKGLP